MDDIYYWYELTRNFQPIEIINSFDVYTEIYTIGKEKISLSWKKSENTSQPTTIEIEPCIKTTLIKDKINKKIFLKYLCIYVIF